jgi:hypothetical protein
MNPFFKNLSVDWKKPSLEEIAILII